MLPVVADICHVSIDFSETTDAAFQVAEIEVAVAVPVVGAVDEDVVGALDEPNGILRLYELLVVFREDGPDELSCHGVIQVKLQMLLAAVQHLHEDLVSVRCPADVGQILVISEVVYLKIYALAGHEVIDSHLNVFRVHSGHRIFDFLEASCPGGDVQERE